jgi:hypothetical protein
MQCVRSSARPPKTRSDKSWLPGALSSVSVSARMIGSIVF